MYFPKRLELSFLSVLALPKACTNQELTKCHSQLEGFKGKLYIAQSLLWRMKLIVILAEKPREQGWTAVGGHQGQPCDY